MRASLSAMSAPFAILKTGSTVAPLVPRRGDFEDWFRAGLGASEAEAPLHAVHLGDALPALRAGLGVVITGSPAMVTDGPLWSLAVEAWLRDAVAIGVRVLGVCYGHQLLARALGGTAADHPLGREMGTVEVALSADGRADPLFAGLPPTLVVQESHSQTVTHLPPEARLLAGNAHDPHQAFAVGHHAWGVQFHPEFDAEIARGYITERAAELEAEGLDPAGLSEAARDSVHGQRLLANFARLVRAGSSA